MDADKEHLGAVELVNDMRLVVGDRCVPASNLPISQLDFSARLFPLLKHIREDLARQSTRFLFSSANTLPDSDTPRSSTLLHEHHGPSPV